MKGERERCLAAGMDDYLTKPLRNQVLKEALKRWVFDAPAPPAPAAVEPLEPTDDRAPAAGGDPEILDESVVAELESLEVGMLTRLLALYFDEAVLDVSALSAAVARRETPAVVSMAHKLKGSSMLGAAHVARIAGQLEAIAQSGHLAGATELLERLERGLEHTRRAFGTRPAEADDHELDTLTATVRSVSSP
jgi:HPt (histidine-containing phosphotransfer) domain-containing protein